MKAIVIWIVLVIFALPVYSQNFEELEMNPEAISHLIDSIDTKIDDLFKTEWDRKQSEFLLEAIKNLVETVDVKYSREVSLGLIRLAKKTKVLKTQIASHEFAKLEWDVVVKKYVEGDESDKTYKFLELREKLYEQIDKVLPEDAKEWQKFREKIKENPKDFLIGEDLHEQINKVLPENTKEKIREQIKDMIGEYEKKEKALLLEPELSIWEKFSIRKKLDEQKKFAKSLMNTIHAQLTLLAKNNTNVISSIAEEIQKTEDVEMKIYFAKTLRFSGNNANHTLPGMLQILDSADNAALRNRIIKILKKMDMQIETLPALLKVWREHRGTDILYILQKMGPKAEAAIPDLLSFFPSATKNEKTGILKILDAVNTPIATKAIISVSLDPHTRIMTALEILSSKDIPQESRELLCTILLDSLDSENTKTRRLSISMLSKILLSEDFVHIHLLELIEKHLSEDTEHLIHELSAHKEKAIIHLLLATLHTNERVRSVAEETITTVGADTLKKFAEGLEGDKKIAAQRLLVKMEMLSITPELQRDIQKLELKFILTSQQKIHEALLELQQKDKITRKELIKIYQLHVQQQNFRQVLPQMILQKKIELLDTVEAQVLCLKQRKVPDSLELQKRILVFLEKERE